MAEVFAGFVAGYAMALISTPLMAIWVLRTRASSAFLSRLLPEGVSAIPLSVLLHGALFMTWTAIGILMGLALLAMKDSGAGMGSLNVAFSLLVFSLTLALFAPFAILIRSFRTAAITGGILVVLIFGWLTPYLAEWSKFDGVPAERKAPEISWFA